MKICKYKSRSKTDHVTVVVFEVHLVLITAVFGVAINYNTVKKFISTLLSRWTYLYFAS